MWIKINFIGIFNKYKKSAKLSMATKDKLNKISGIITLGMFIVILSVDVKVNHSLYFK